MARSQRQLQRPMRFARGGADLLLELPRPLALELLNWIGLGRAEFGAIEACALLPLCRRRLWPEERNFDGADERARWPAGTLRRLTEELARRIEGVEASSLIHFG